MEKRLLIAIFLSFLVVYVYQALFVRPLPKTVPAQPGPNLAAPGGSGGPGGAGGPGGSGGPGGLSGSGRLEAEATTPSAAIVGETTERDVRVDLPDVVATFTNRGARLKSWRLKRFLDPGGAPLELIANDLGPDAALPFSLRVPDPR